MEGYSNPWISRTLNNILNEQIGAFAINNSPYFILVLWAIINRTLSKLRYPNLLSVEVYKFFSENYRSWMVIVFFSKKKFEMTGELLR